MESNKSQKLAPSQLVNDNFHSLINQAGVSSVYGEPVQVGDALIIPAAEIISAGGFGYGEGEGEMDADEEGNEGHFNGGGGGGGGYSFSRPVAMVIVNQDGVQVQQVFDLTKIALAAITAFGFMVSTVSSIYKMRQKMLK